MKHFILISKKRAGYFLLGGAALIALLFLLRSAGLPAEVSGAIKKDNPIYFVYTDENKISLSFDAAWGCEHTEDILSILRANEVQATFFLTDIWLEAYPEMAQKIAACGHEIAMHSVSHPHMNNLSREEIIREIEDNKALITSVTAFEPTLFRFPFGEYNNLSVNIVKELGYYPIQWSVDSLDWQDEATAASIFKRVNDNLHAGAIILMHNNGNYTADALKEIIPAAKAVGYRFVPIGELIYHGEYTVDIQGGQSPK